MPRVKSGRAIPEDSCCHDPDAWESSDSRGLTQYRPQIVPKSAKLSILITGRGEKERAILTNRCKVVRLVPLSHLFDVGKGHYCGAGSRVKGPESKVMVSVAFVA